MKPISEAWFVQIDITNYCTRSCLYCSRYNRHLRPDQRRNMDMAGIKQALDSLRDWPNRIGIIGGEPLLHPLFEDICAEIRSRFPASKMGLWTSGTSSYSRLKPTIDSTFSFLAYNEHNPDQLKVCRHQPITVAIKDVVLDPVLRKQLIDGCWVQRTWCPTINHFGAYFCECAAAQDVLFNGGANAWPVTEQWWRRTQDQFQDQVQALCENCGMAIPMPRDLIGNAKEKMSKTVVDLMAREQLERAEAEDIEVYDHVHTRAEIKEYSRKWTPGNYRGDLKEDSVSNEGLGYQGNIEGEIS
jgi:organic radical activating enzyme